jgi:hypothetical protein
MLIKKSVTHLAKLALLLAALTLSGGAYAQVALNLTTGWNLLGNSSAAPVDVAATFGDPAKITTVWTWNKTGTKWAFYAPSMAPSVLAAYAQGKGYDVLTSIAPKEGFWVNALTAAALTGPTAAGVTLVESDLQRGWNLMGSADNKTPSQLNQALGSSLNAAGKAIVTAWAWDAPNTAWKFFSPSLEAQGGTALADYITRKGYLPFSTALSASEGFWLNIGAAARAPVLLGAAGNYVILAKTEVSTVPASVITGDVGVSPAATSYLTGFSLTMVGTTSATSPQVTGNLFGADMTTPTNSNLTTAVSNMEAAYTDAATRPAPPDFLNVGTGEIGGQTLAPGLYTWTTGVTISADVVISGGPTDVWIFQIPGNLTMSAAKNVVLSGGAKAKNIFWQVAGFVDLGASAHFEGIILSQTAITLKTGASMNGRALAQTAVILDQSTVTQPAP